MSSEETTVYWSSSARSEGPVDNPAPSSSTSSSMARTAVIASVTVVCFILVCIAIAILLFCLYRRRKQNRNLNQPEERRPRSSHQSSTLRSDHPYENPSLTRNLRANHMIKSSKPGSGRDSDPYDTLRGQSLPHHYQGLGQKPQLPDVSDYDELMASSEGTNSDYYFKLEPGSRSNTVVRDGAQSGVRPVVNQTPTDPDQAYEIVQIGNTTGNNANESKDVPVRKDTDQKDGGDPYYFKVGRPQGGSFTAPATLRDVQPSNNDKRLPSETGDEKRAEPPIATKPSLATKNSYDKLNRSDLGAPRTEDINANEYNKLLPRLSVQPQKSVPTSDGYLKVSVGHDITHLNDADDDDDSLKEANGYNKLDRGVEKEIDDLIVTDRKSSTAENKHEDVPVEL